MRAVVYDPPPGNGFPYLAVIFFDDDTVHAVAADSYEEAEMILKRFAENPPAL